MIDPRQLRERAAIYRHLAEAARGKDIAATFLVLAREFDAEAASLEEQVKAAEESWTRR
jgi:hypothetical protein